jgi:cyclic beta-1,2-glucan synthetase
VPPALALMLPLGWLLLPSPLLWTLAMMALLFVPELLASDLWS